MEGDGGEGGRHDSFRSNSSMSVFIIVFIHLIFLLDPLRSTNILPQTRPIGGRIGGNKC